MITRCTHTLRLHEYFTSSTSSSFRTASGSSELRGCLRRNRPDHLARGILEPRVARMSQAKRAGPPLARHLRAQNLEDVSGETGRTTSRAASQSPVFRGRLRRNGPDHLSRGISEHRIWRTSQAKRAGPPLARPLRAKFFEDVSGETLNPGQLRNQFFEDVSSETARTTSKKAQNAARPRLGRN